MIGKYANRRNALRAAAVVVGLAAWPLQAADIKSHTYAAIDSVGWIEPSDLQAAGEISGAPVDNLLLGTGMGVYCKFSTPPQLDDQFLIVRQSEQEIRHPSGGSKVGYRIDVLGQLVIEAEENGLFRSKILTSYNSIYRGDKLVPFQKAAPQVEITKNYSNIEGQVLTLDANLTMTGQNQIVYLDKGADQGVSVGNIYEVYRPADEIDKATKDSPLPDVVYGKLLVLRVNNQTASALVLTSKAKIDAGARFRSIIE